jgi:hypothetical protein
MTTTFDFSKSFTKKRRAVLDEVDAFRRETGLDEIVNNALSN